eukprot:761600-Hanusia_phi.AAC.5
MQHAEKAGVRNRVLEHRTFHLPLVVIFASSYSLVPTIFSPIMSTFRPARDPAPWVEAIATTCSKAGMVFTADGTSSTRCKISSTGTLPLVYIIGGYFVEVGYGGGADAGNAEVCGCTCHKKREGRGAERRRRRRRRRRSKFIVKSDKPSDDGVRLLSCGAHND